MNNYSYYHVNQTGENTADDNSAISESKSRTERTQKRKGAGNNYRALELREKQIHDSSETCSQNCRRNLRRQSYNSWHCYRCRHDCQNLLNCKDDKFIKLWSVFYVVNKFHIFLLFFLYIIFCVYFVCVFCVSGFNFACSRG